MCLLWAGFGVIAAAGAFALGNGIELLLTYHFLRRSMYRPRFEATAAELFAIAKDSLPFGMVGALLGAMRQTDRVMLRLVGDASAVGVFSAAWVLIDQLEMISDLVFGASFAAGMRLFARDREGFDGLFRTSIVVAAALGLPIAAGVCLVAPDVIDLVYGGREGFGEARIVLRLLAWHVLASFALQVVSLPLLASKRESAFARVLVPALAANVVLDVLLVPRYRAQGAAAVAVVVGFASLLGAGWLSWSWVRLAPVRKILSVVVATVAMTGAAYVGRRHLGMWGAVAVGTVVHAALLLALRAVTFDELLSLLRRRKPVPRAEPPQPAAEEA
jgi:O-antigen/teichoic acid export membrane protein